MEREEQTPAVCRIVSLFLLLPLLYPFFLLVSFLFSSSLVALFPLPPSICLKQSARPFGRGREGEPFGRGDDKTIGSVKGELTFLFFFFFFFVIGMLYFQIEERCPIMGIDLGKLNKARENRDAATVSF